MSDFDEFVGEFTEKEPKIKETKETKETKEPEKRTMTGGKDIPTAKEFLDGLIEDVKETPIELYLYLAPVPLLVYLTSQLDKSLAVFINVVGIGLYTNYVFQTFK